MLKNWWPYVIIVLVLAAFLIAKFLFWPVILLVAILAVILCFLYFEQALILFAFTLPFEKTLSFDAGGVTLRFSHFLLVALLIAWLIRSLMQKSLKIFWDQSFILLLFYLLISGLSLRGAPNFNRGLEIFIFNTFTFLGFWFLFQLFREKPARFFNFLKTLLISAIVVGIFGLLQVGGDLIGAPIWLTGIGKGYAKGVLGFPRMCASFFEPLYFGSFIILVLPLVYLQIKTKNQLLSNKWLKILLLLLTLDLFLTFARSAYLAFAVELIILVIISIRFFFKPMVLKIGAVFILLAALFLFSFLNFPNIYPYKVQDALNHVVETTDFSSFERINSGTLALELYRENPISGVGLGQFGPYFAHFPFDTPDTGWQTANNETLEILAENGILGFLPILLFYLYLIFRQIVGLLKSKTALAKKLNLGFLIALLGIGVQWQFFSTLYIIYIFAFFALALSYSYISIKEENEKDLARI